MVYYSGVILLFWFIMTLVYCITINQFYFLAIFAVSVMTLTVTTSNPENIYLFKANNRNTKKRYEISSKSTIKTPEQFP